jgi:peptide/nickel transport system substrate-binding protein
VRVVLPEPFAPFLEYFGSVFILPRHTFESAVQGRRFAALYNISTQPRLIAGCGPFRVKEVRAGGYVLLERNPEYWAVDKRGQRLPYIDELLLVSGGPGDAQNLFLSRETDVYEQGRPDEYEVFKQAAAGGKFRLEDLGAGLDGDFLFFNQNTGKDVMGRPFVQPAKLKWFRNKKFRQAISCARDRDGIVRERRRFTPSFLLIIKNGTILECRASGTTLRERARCWRKPDWRTGTATERWTTPTAHRLNSGFARTPVIRSANVRPGLSLKI